MAFRGGFQREPQRTKKALVVIGPLDVEDVRHNRRSWMDTSYTLWLFNIAMENGPFIDGLPIENGDFPWLC